MPNSKKQYLLCLLFPLAFCSVSARAGDGKSEGGLHGYVTDAITKKPLSGVVVSAIIPGTNSPKEVTTDADGYFRLSSLPVSPVVVTIQFDKKGYQAYKRPGVQIKEKTTVKLNIEFLPEGKTPADSKEIPCEEQGDNESAEYPLLRMVQSD